MPANTSMKRNLPMADDPSKVLGLTVGKHNPTPGTYIPRAEAQSAPELSFDNADPNKTYMVVGLDVDAPFPSFNLLGPILHWIQPGLQLKAGTLTTTEPFVANYIGPAPPPGSSPHRYVFMLYEQPAGFDGSKYAPPNGQNLSSLNRMRYDLDDWEKKANLSAPVAVNYFNSN